MLLVNCCTQAPRWACAITIILYVHWCRLFYGPLLVANPNAAGVRDGGLSDVQSHVAAMNQVFKKYNTGIQFHIKVCGCDVAC